MLVLNVSKQWRRKAVFPHGCLKMFVIFSFRSTFFSFCKNMAVLFIFYYFNLDSLTLGYTKYDGMPCFHFQFCH